MGNIAKQLLRPLAYLAGLHASGQVTAFLRAHDRTREHQEQVLRRLVRLHTDTAFGRDHGFDKIRTVADFRRAVPVASYERFGPYIQRVLSGETTALLPPGHDVLMFSMTSGTTGRPKYIPVTRQFAGELRRGWNVFGVKVLQDHPRAWMRHILQISSPMREFDSPTNLPCGAVSGLLAVTQKRIVRRFYVVPPEVSSIADPASRYYTALRCGVGRDVALITTANPSSTIKLIETGQQYAQRLIRDVRDGTLTPPSPIDKRIADMIHLRPSPLIARRMEEGIARNGRLLPRHFWDIEFLTNWTGGTLHLYLRRLKELFPGVPIRDIGLLASEGRFSVPLTDDSPAGVAEICGNFLEFIPTSEHGRDNPPTLLAHELEVGQEYYLVFSNYSGLMRYNMDDCIRVVGRYGQSPVIEFLHRGKHTASITGEKLTEHQVVEAMRLAGTARIPGNANLPIGANVTGLDIDRFTLQGHFAAVPYYLLSVEAGTDGHASRLAQSLDEQLMKLNGEYHGKRTSGRLGPIRPRLLPPGSLDHAEREKLRHRGRPEQYKHQYLVTEVVEDTP